MKTERPPILYGAAILAVLSLAWSGYAIADLMHSGKFGLSVAFAGDVGWITVLWAEYKGVTLGGRRWAPTAAGWLIATGVALLLVIHGNEAGGHGQAIAGPFVVLVGKIVWAFALEAMKDPAAPTPEQRAELHTLMRDTAHETGMLHARAQARIAEIRAEASVTLARDEADFEISIERMEKRAELGRRTPLALPPGSSSTSFDRSAEQAIEVIGEQGDAPASALTRVPRKQQPPTSPAGPTGEVVEDVSALFREAHAPVVYFLRNGNRLKIGTSQNLRRRITSLSLRREDVVRVEHGDQEYERSLHRRFVELRVDETEWFELRGSLARYLGEPEAQPAEPAEPEAQPAAELHTQLDEPQTLTPVSTPASPQAAAPEPQAQPAEPGDRPFGFSAHLNAQSAQRAQSVARVAELVAQDPGITSAQVAELLAVSPATAKRYLREARQARPGQPKDGYA